MARNEPILKKAAGRLPVEQTNMKCLAAFIGFPTDRGSLRVLYIPTSTREALSLIAHVLPILTIRSHAVKVAFGCYLRCDLPKEVPF